MFFILSKTLGFFALPSNVLMAIGLVGLVLLCTRFRRLASWLVVTSLVLIAFVGYSPLGKILILPLEQRFPPWNPAQGPPDGIVVLGGAISPELSLARGAVALNEFGRTHHRHRRAGAPLSQCAHHLFRRHGVAVQRGARGPSRREGIGGARRRARPHHGRRAIAQYDRECRVLAAHRPAEAGRALAPGDVGVSYAARDRGVPRRRLSGRSLSGRLAHPRDRSMRRRRSLSLTGGLRMTDFAVHEWVGLARLSADRSNRGIVSRRRNRGRRHNAFIYRSFIAAARYFAFALRPLGKDPHDVDRYACRAGRAAGTSRRRGSSPRGAIGPKPR